MQLQAVPCTATPRTVRPPYLEVVRWQGHAGWQETPTPESNVTPSPSGERRTGVRPCRRMD